MFEVLLADGGPVKIIWNRLEFAPGMYGDMKCEGKTDAMDVFYDYEVSFYFSCFRGSCPGSASVALKRCKASR